MYPQEGALFEVREKMRLTGAKGVNPDVTPGGLEASLIFASEREIYSELLIILSDRSWKNKE